MILADLAALAKPRMVAMILASTGVGFYLGAPGTPDWPLLGRMLGWTALAAAGTLTLNQVLEVESDRKMDRTRGRPLPSGRLSPTSGLAFGVALAAAGLLGLSIGVNPLCGAVTAGITASYLFLYTPLKRWTAFSTLWGGIPGALPPVAGWAAARGTLDVQAGVLFAILFLWQLPHALAIACRYRDDYARAGIQVLPTVLPEGSRTGLQVVLGCVALLVAGLMPAQAGMAGPRYFMAALLLGTAFLGFGVALAVTRSEASARRMVVASLVYLPALLACLALDKRG